MKREKANDDIPEDEMLLAEAIAAASDRGMKWTSGLAFVPPNQDEAVMCCAVGALVLAGKTALTHGSQYSSNPSLWGVTHGNDMSRTWRQTPRDDGESLGWAFRCAMTQEDER